MHTTPGRPHYIGLLFAAVLMLSCQASRTEAPAPENEAKSAAVRGPEARDGDSIRIGVISSKTGDNAEMGSYIFQAARIFSEEWSARGGLAGKKIAILEFDDQSTPLGARKAAQAAADENVAAVIGAMYSSESLAASEILNAARIPMIVPAGTNPAITLGKEFVFRVCFNDVIQAKALADFAYAKCGYRRAAILTNTDNKYSLSMSQHFKAFFTTLGGKVGPEIKYLGDVTDYAALGASVGAAGADVIFLPAYFRDAASIVKAVRFHGVKTPFLGSDGWSQRILEQAGSLLDGSHFASYYDPKDPAISASAFRARFMELFGRRDLPVLYLSYDALSVLAQAVRKAGAADREAIRRELAETRRFQGLTGSISFDHNGDALKPVTILGIVDSAFSLADRVEMNALKIASIFSKTGYATQDSLAHLNAVRLAVDELNLRGGVRNSWLHLTELDNQSSPLGSKAAAHKAIELDALCVIGASHSSHSLAMAPVLQTARIPMITPVSTNPEITRVGDYIFRTCYTDPFQGRLLANFAAADLKAKTAVILINQNSKFSIGLSDFFRRQFGANGGSVLWTGEYLEQDSDFLPLVESIKKHAPDIVFLPGYFRDSGLIIKQARLNGVRATFLGGDGWNDEMYKYGGNHIAGCYFSSFWHRDLPDAKSRAFVKSYEERFGPLNNNGAAQAYDTVGVLALAVDRAKSPDRADLRDALAAVKDYRGTTGTISFDENRDQMKSAVILRFENTSAVFVKAVAP